MQIHSQSVTDVLFPPVFLDPLLFLHHPRYFVHCHLLDIPIAIWKPFIYLWSTFRDSIFFACIHVSFVSPFPRLFPLIFCTSSPSFSFHLFLVSTLPRSFIVFQSKYTLISEAACLSLRAYIHYYRSLNSCAFKTARQKTHSPGFNYINTVPDILSFGCGTFSHPEAPLAAHAVYLHLRVLRDESLINFLGNSPQNRSPECCVSLKTLPEFCHAKDELTAVF